MSIFLLRGIVHSVHQNTYASALYLCTHSQHCDSPTVYAHNHSHTCHTNITLKEI